jgi:hypothetical protein
MPAMTSTTEAAPLRRPILRKHGLAGQSATLLPLMTLFHGPDGSGSATPASFALVAAFGTPGAIDFTALRRPPQEVAAAWLEDPLEQH